MAFLIPLALCAFVGLTYVILFVGKRERNLPGGMRCPV